MKLFRIILAIAVLASVAGLAYVAQQAESSGAGMVAAAGAFVDSLKYDQRAKALHPFESKERINWNFVPMQDKDKKSTRKGLPLEEMTAAQKKAALALVKAGTSEIGNETANKIMSLEAILKAQESGAMVRNPEWYFFTIFGTPSKTGSWGWRVEGHHLSLNFTMDGTQVVAATPFFFGANPAQIKSGPDKGKRILAAAEDFANELFDSLSADQKALAAHAKPFPEPKQGKPTPEVGEAVGLPAATMTPAQKKSLTQLLRHYIERNPKDVADVEWKLVQDAGFDKVHFAYNGSTKPGEPRTYRVQGPTFVIEFLNSQYDSAGNPANHIHSAWRRIKGDFGLNP
ncbi:MAG: DUF3500 domain-containing protein [Planctomycetes bacterium]|nr:DUF3500 domain-containing protein [Planctomycetota bacterium]